MPATDPTQGGNQVGIIGLGSMGAGMASRLLESGYRVVAWNRTAAKREALASKGAVPAPTPAAVAGQCETVLVSVADQDAVTEVLFGKDGAAGSLRPGSVLIETSTVSPEFAAGLAARLGAAGHLSVEARLLGNAKHAASGELRVMAGGPKETFEQVQPLLAVLGKEVTHVGDTGSAATMKLVLNMLMGIEMQALAEAILLGERAGLPRQAVIQAIAASGFSSPVMRFKCGVMGRGAFTPADFRLALMHKDMGLVRAEAERLGVSLASASASHEVLAGAVEQGMGELDCAAVLPFLAGQARQPAAGPAA